MYKPNISRNAVEFQEIQGKAEKSTSEIAHKLSLMDIEQLDSVSRLPLKCAGL